MITIHHLNNSRSQRILWLLEELKIPYQLKHYQRDALTMLAPRGLIKIHPLGKSPVLTDAENTVAESAVIMEYIIAKYGQGRLRPENASDEFWKYTYWLHYAEGSAMTPLILSLVFSKIKSQSVPFFIKPLLATIANTVLLTFVNPEIKNHMNYLEAHLSKSPWFAGKEFTAADIQMSFVIEAAEAQDYLSEAHPKLKEFLKKIHGRPAYKMALEKGGPYKLGFS